MIGTACQGPPGREQDTYVQRPWGQEDLGAQKTKPSPGQAGAATESDTIEQCGLFDI